MKSRTAERNAEVGFFGQTPGLALSAVAADGATAPYSPAASLIPVEASGFSSALHKAIKSIGCSTTVSLVLHLLFLLIVGYGFLSKNVPPPPPKIVQMKLTIPPPPPVVKEKEPEPPAQEKQPEVQKTEKRIEVRQPMRTVAAKPVVVPQAMQAPKVPDQPAAAEARVSRHVTSAHVVVAAATVTSRSPLALPASPEATGATGPTRRLQKNIEAFSSASSSAPVSVRGAPVAAEGRGSERVGMVARSVGKLASFSEAAPRVAPAIFDQDALKGYLGSIRKKIEQEKDYPAIARRAGSQGKVKVRFTILKDGKIDNLVLVEEAPHAPLNEEALAAVKRAGPFDPLPDSIGKESLSVTLPFNFQLN